MCDAKYYSILVIPLFILVEFTSFGIPLKASSIYPSFIDHYLFFCGIYLLSMFHTHPSSPYVFMRGIGDAIIRVRSGSGREALENLVVFLCVNVNKSCNMNR
jgi:hypothetical protein